VDSISSTFEKGNQALPAPKGNPQARSFFEIVAYLRKKEGLRLKVRSIKNSPRAIRKRSASFHRKDCQDCCV
jgi:hypothetical protein